MNEGLDRQQLVGAVVDALRETAVNGENNDENRAVVALCERAWDGDRVALRACLRLIVQVAGINPEDLKP